MRGLNNLSGNGALGTRVSQFALNSGAEMDDENGEFNYFHNY